MGGQEPMNTLEPDWDQLSNDLQDLIVTKGALAIGRMSGAYKSKFGKTLNLHGRGLRKSADNGNLRGIRFNAKANTLELQKPPTSSTLTSSAATPRVSAAVSRSTQPRGGYSVSAAASRSAQPRVAHRHQALTDPDQPSPAKPTLLPYHLISSPKDLKDALDAISPTEAQERKTLQKICAGLTSVALQLDGEKLGTDAGKISFVKQTLKSGYDQNAVWKLEGRAWMEAIKPSQDRQKIAGFWPDPLALIFDVVRLEKTTTGRNLLREELLPLLEDADTLKVVHDFVNKAIALKRHFGAGLLIRRVLDTQLAFEALHGGVRAEMASISKAFGGGDVPHRESTSRPESTCGGAAASTVRPVDSAALGPAAQAVILLLKTGEKNFAPTLSQRELDNVVEASQRRVDFAMISRLHDTRRVTFRKHGSCFGGGTGSVMVSLELKQAQEIMSKTDKKTEMPAASTEQPRPTTRASSRCAFPKWFPVGKEEPSPEPARDVNSPHEVLERLPKHLLQEHLSERHTTILQDLQEVVLDEGRRPKALIKGRGRIYLCSNESVVVTKEDIEKLVGRLDLEGKFGDDNRAGFPGQLHRLSVMRRTKGGRIFAATLRIGRFFKGCAGSIDDLLFHVADSPGKPKRPPSILILGEAGTGKTTVIRDISRKISATQTVVIVDTSNEIAGDGDIPHCEAIGESRRIMVPDKAAQHSVMIEALQNHTPQTIVVDEISSKKEAKACLDIKSRGVRLVASAHGDLQSLLKNPELNTLVGGTTSVTLGDATAKESNGGNKTQTARAGQPVFDTIIELQRGQVNTWSIIRNVGPAVDALLSKESYEVERRTNTKHSSHATAKGSGPDDVVVLLKYEREVERSQLQY